MRVRRVEGELRRGIAAGGDPSKCVFAGVGKTGRGIEVALRAGLCCFNVESESELLVLSSVATQMQRRAAISHYGPSCVLCGAYGRVRTTSSGSVPKRVGGEEPPRPMAPRDTNMTDRSSTILR